MIYFLSFLFNITVNPNLAKQNIRVVKGVPVLMEASMLDAVEEIPQSRFLGLLTLILTLTLTRHNGELTNRAGPSWCDDPKQCNQGTFIQGEQKAVVAFVKSSVYDTGTRKAN